MPKKFENLGKADHYLKPKLRLIIEKKNRKPEQF